MKRRILYYILVGFFLLISAGDMQGQGLHFSQFYNTPLLTTAANTALMPEGDYRAGAIYRHQWTNVPVPFSTFSAYTDFKLLKNYEETNWLGIGGVFFNDKAGNGELSLTKIQINAAYHLQAGLFHMFSIGMGAAIVQRSVNFSKLTFDSQWDGFRFNSKNANGENYAFQSTNYVDFSAGVNYAFIPNEDVYLRLGIGLGHINRPRESFYDMDNRLGFRPAGSMDLVLKAGERWITDVSAYYTQQKGASELLFGAKASYNVAPQFSVPTVLSLGLYSRWADAVIPVIGLEWSNVGVMASFDITTSALHSATGSIGAFELSIIYRGLYSGARTHDRGGYNCPRF